MKNQLKQALTLPELQLKSCHIEPNKWKRLPWFTIGRSVPYSPAFCSLDVVTEDPDILRKNIPITKFSYRLFKRKSMMFVPAKQPNLITRQCIRLIRVCYFSGLELCQTGNKVVGWVKRQTSDLQ